MRKLIVLLLALCLSGTGQVFAEGFCEEFEERTTPFSTKCLKMYYIPWVAFGCYEDGSCWSTLIKGANMSNNDVRGLVYFDWNLYPMAPFAPDGHRNNLSAVFTDNRTIPLGVLRHANGGGLWLHPENSAELNFLYAQGGCDQYGDYCPLEPNPDMSKLSVGSVLVGYIADAPGPLRGLPKPSGEFYFKPAQGDWAWQASEPAFDPAPIWRMPAKASVDNFSGFAFIMGNRWEYEVTVRGNLINQDGVILGTQTWNLVGKSVRAMYITSPRSDSNPGFGKEEVFPDGKDFTGWLELEVISPEEGTIVSAGLQFTGKAMSSADVQPFPRILPTGSPDLTAYVTYPGAATVNIPQTLTATIANAGTASTGANFYNRFQIKTPLEGNVSAGYDLSLVLIPALNAGDGDTTSVSYTFTSTGTYLIRACTDVTNVISESNEDNNCSLWKSVNVTAGQ